MASYHRILEAFDRYTNDNDLQCDVDIHPWDVRINQERWAGKIRLVGFVDVFFLISYTGNSRFEKGIVIYKDVDDLRDVQRDGVKRTPEVREQEQKELDHAKLEARNKRKREEEAALKIKRLNTQASIDGANSPTSDANGTAISNTPAAGASSEYKPNGKDVGATKASDTNVSSPGTRLYSQQELEEEELTYFDQDSMVFKVSAKGHEIHLKMKYSKDDVKRYDIELRKPNDPLQSRRVMRALRRHDALDLLEDTMNVGIVSSWEVAGHALGHVTGGGVIEDSKKKFNTGLNAQSRSKGMMMEAER